MDKFGSRYRWVDASATGIQGGRVSTQSQITVCAVCGAIVGAAAGYLFFTPAGRALRDRIEPAVDDLKRDFQRFQKTLEKVGDLANDSLRVVNEFNNARAQAFPSATTSH
jgi:gas vesicle protein